MWDDSAKPYDAQVSFNDWLKEQVSGMLSWTPKDLHTRTKNRCRMDFFRLAEGCAPCARGGSPDLEPIEKS